MCASEPSVCASCFGQMITSMMNSTELSVKNHSSIHFHLIDNAADFSLLRNLRLTVTQFNLQIKSNRAENRLKVVE